MKFIFELIITIIIVFFLWNILKRMFFSSFYKFPRNENQQNATTQSQKKNINSKINWDAETVEYEEIKENNETKK